FQNVIGQGMGLLFLKYGRDAEREADRLGLGYMGRTGYEPTAALDVFSMLDRQGQIAGRATLPTWLSTHPAPADRRAALQEIVNGLPAAERGREDREEYLRHLDNLVYGEDPRQGYFKNNRFIHPELGFQFTIPPGWKAQNLPSAVIAKSEDGSAGVQLTVVPGDTPEAAAQHFFDQEGLKVGGAERREINGLPATVGSFQAQSQQGSISGAAAHIALGGRIYQVLTIVSAENAAVHEQAMLQALGSFAAVNAQDRTAPAPPRIEVFALDRASTINALTQSRKSAVAADRLALLNGVTIDEPLAAGRLLKWVQ
ncbi:MAG: M48 family metalloprotease, partial [Gammaproteobacteria bacterium]